VNVAEGRLRYVVAENVFALNPSVSMKGKKYAAS
jgi:hypothetical protein